MLWELQAEWGRLDSYLYDLSPSPTLILRCRATTRHECDVNKKAQANRYQTVHLASQEL